LNGQASIDLQVFIAIGKGGGGTTTIQTDPGAVLEAVNPAAAVVPEPSTLTLLGLMAAGLGGYFAWRRQKQPEGT
jgi:hypothetical protein